MGKRVLALVTLLCFATGCFGYNPSAKRWSYLGDAILIAGGGAAIAPPPPRISTVSPTYAQRLADAL